MRDKIAKCSIRLARSGPRDNIANQSAYYSLRKFTASNVSLNIDITADSFEDNNVDCDHQPQMFTAEHAHDTMEKIVGSLN